jgi:hypothetical protein
MKGTCTLLWMWCTLHTGRELPCMCDKNLKRPIQLAHYFGCGTQYTLSTRGSHTGCGWICSDQCVSKLESNVQYIHIYSGTCPLCFLQCSIQACSTSIWSNSDSLSSYLWHFFFNEETRQDKSKSRSRSPSVWSTFWRTEYPSPCFWNTSGQTSISWFFCVCLSFPEYCFV